MIWLGIDTANTPLSVAIVKDGQVLVEETSTMAVNHSLRAMPAIEEVCRKANVEPADLDAIAVSEGPGSYTGVRIGVTIAKTLAWTLQKPLYGVSSLHVLAMNGLYFNGLVCPIVDARRLNVYSGAYRMEEGRMIEVIEDQHCALADLLQQLKDQALPVLFIGQDVQMHQEQIVECLGDQALIAPAPLHAPRASMAIQIAQEQQEAAQVHPFVPEYRRITEAEANWLKTQTKEHADG